MMSAGCWTSVIIQLKSGVAEKWRGSARIFPSTAAAEPPREQPGNPRRMRVSGQARQLIESMTNNIAFKN
jgi:hypothetical protein